mmetsp:Transcript_6649/g.11875  ORF Transcript_6649/g.11875 Transcript_6649/m.11875 type:complete len:146 (-) Transcript_6649:330-767(-)
MKNLRTWSERKTIVCEAYSRERNIKPTAEKYGVEPANIRRWKKTLDQTFASADEDQRKHLFKLKTLSKGPKRQQSEKYGELREYYNSLRNSHRIVTVGMLCYQLKRLDPSITVSMHALRNRLYRWLQAECIVQRRVTSIIGRELM